LNICEFCSSIESLELKNCDKITDNDLIKLLMSCPLKYINIDLCWISKSILDCCRMHNPGINIYGREKKERILSNFEMLSIFSN
jgi:hypothetical protein